MTESPSANPEKVRPNFPARIGWTLLIVATLYVCYFSHLGALGFLGPDEPRYAWIARDMAETGDWITPRLYGKPWFEKPPLFYWGAAICFKLFGVSETAARLPSAISALLATLALAWLAWRLYGGETARWTLLLLPTTIGMIGFSHAAATDMPFSGMLTIAMVCAAVVLRLAPSEARGTNPPSTNLSTLWAALVLFGFFLGLAVLAKGPAGIILCGGAVFFWALFTKRWPDAFRLLHPAAIAAFCVTALPWYILCARRNPDFFRVFIIEHNFKRYLTPEFQHIQPFWFYIPVLLVALLPWTASSIRLVAVPYQMWKLAKRPTLSGLFFMFWAAFTIVFFSLSKSKLPGYILPAVPPVGLFLARGVSVRILNAVPGDRGMRIAVGLSLIALGIFGALQVERIPLISPSLIIAAGGIPILIMANLRRGLALSVCALLLAIALALTGNTREVLDQRYSARDAPKAARIIWNAYSPEESSTYRLTRSFQYGLNFYLHRELPEWSPDRRLPGWVFAMAKDKAEMENLGLSCPLNSLRPAVIVCKDPGLTTRDTRGGELD
ncbi:MAG TPA: glycosyltransferase family 39 protein [Candidatus Acidoferrum sp.]|nr:glycosyltransferase family 39 protein [Candidatus Acidoferrum sp.]